MGSASSAGSDRRVQYCERGKPVIWEVPPVLWSLSTGSPVGLLTRRLNVQSGPRNGEVCSFSPLKSVAPCDQEIEKVCLGSKEGLCRKSPVVLTDVQPPSKIGKGSNLGCAHFKASSVCGGACASRESLKWEAEGTKWKNLWK